MSGIRPADYVPTSVIVHEIPKHSRSEPGPGPIMSDVVDELGGDLRDYFRDKIRDTLIEKGHRVAGDMEGECATPSLIAGILGSPDKLLEASRQLAQQLYEVQSGANSPGLLVLLFGTADGSPALAILKLERQQAVRVVRQEVSDGLMHFSISHLRDLMLNERTRVFKAGLFAIGGDGVIQGMVSDEQRGTRRDQVATFFLETFLGCSLKLNPQATTKAFFASARVWINDRVDDPNRQTRYLLAVMAELNADTGELDPQEFARRNLSADDRDGFLHYLAANDVATTVFVKDTKLIDSQLRSVRYDIENNIVIIVPQDHTDQVSFGKDANDAPVTQVKGALKAIGGR